MYIYVYIYIYGVKGFRVWLRVNWGVVLVQNGGKLTETER
jgi:hypothetical protein